MTRFSLGLIVCIALGLLSALQIVIVLGLGIWAPSAVIWETFGVHYTAYPTLALNYHFIGNAMGFAVLYAYAPSYIVHRILVDFDDFTKFQIYLLLVYTIQVAVVVGVSTWIASRRLLLRSKSFLILVVGIFPLWLSIAYINILSVNYFWIEPSLYLIAGTLWVLAVRKKLEAGVGLVTFIGFALAIAVWTKFTYVVSIGPFLVLPFLFAKCNAPARASLFFFAGFLLTTVCLCIFYFVGHLEYISLFYNDLMLMYSYEYIHQHTPDLWKEVSEWPNTKSALQAIILIAAVTTMFGIAFVVRKPSFVLSVFLFFTILVAALFVPFLRVRTAANTFVDATIFLSFVIGVWVAVFAEKFSWRNCSWSIFSLLFALLFYQTFDHFGFSRWVDKLQLASLSARGVYEDVNKHRNLPVVYYWLFPDGRGPIWHGPALWPSPYLYVLLSGHQETKQRYLEKYYQGTSHRAVLDGPLKIPHVMVVQEYLSKESPVYNQVFATYLEFDVVLENPKNICHRHTVDLAWTDFPIVDNSIVTVCVIE